MNFIKTKNKEAPESSQEVFNSGNLAVGEYIN